MMKARSYPLRGLFGLNLIAAFAVLAGCKQPAPQESANPQDTGAEPALNLPTISRPMLLDRERLLTAVAKAASDEALGVDQTAAQRDLDGKQFQLRIRFGCQGPSKELAREWLGWAYDRDTGTLRVRAKPTLIGDDPLVREVGGDAFEAVEGFWIPRPWLLASACPATVAVRAEQQEEADNLAVAKPTTAPAEKTATRKPTFTRPRIGIAHFFRDTDARTGRRSGRAYESVKSLDSEQPIGSQGFDLVLSGRLQALPSGRVISCVTRSLDSAPECLVSADFDKVWIEKPATGVVIAEWGGG